MDEGKVPGVIEEAFAKLRASVLNAVGESDEPRRRELALKAVDDLHLRMTTDPGALARLLLEATTEPAPTIDPPESPAAR